MKVILNLIYLLCILFVARGITYSQTTPQKFFDALIYDKANITEYINKDELEKSNRLGITYTGVKNKFMLGYELPDEIKEGIKSGKYKYEVKEQPLTDAYTQVTLSVPEANFSKVYYFDNGFVSNSTYYSSLWQKKESRYFRFSIEEPKYFNEYCIKRLDDFVDMIADTLGFTISEKRILEQQKLGYIFCADEKGVEKITGFSAKGLAMLGTDEVVTSYQTHFHEVAHLLINYKLKNLGLYTLPFFMEGFAVAVGGRGGMAPRVVTDLGYYLQKTGELTYDSIFTFEQFKNIDGSMTYPVAGLYNSFLLSELGGEKYLELYKKVNGTLEYVKGIKKEDIDLHENKSFNTFLNNWQNYDMMFFVDNDTLFPSSFFANWGGEYMKLDSCLKFFIKDKLYFGPGKSIIYDEYFDDNYLSKKYNELEKQISILGSRLVVLADSFSVRIYNLYNDELVLNYNTGFDIHKRIVPVKDGHYYFYVRKDLFEFDINDTMNHSVGY